MVEKYPPNNFTNRDFIDWSGRETYLDNLIGTATEDIEATDPFDEDDVELAEQIELPQDPESPRV